MKQRKGGYGKKAPRRSVLPAPGEAGDPGTGSEALSWAAGTTDRHLQAVGGEPADLPSDSTMTKNSQRKRTCSWKCKIKQLNGIVE